MEHKWNFAASGLKEYITKRVLYWIFHPLVYVTVSDVTSEEECHKLQRRNVNQRKDIDIPDHFPGYSCILKHPAAFVSFGVFFLIFKFRRINYIFIFVALEQWGIKAVRMF